MSKNMRTLTADTCMYLQCHVHVSGQYLIYCFKLMILYVNDAENWVYKSRKCI